MFRPSWLKPSAWDSPGLCPAANGAVSPARLCRAHFPPTPAPGQLAAQSPAAGPGGWGSAGWGWASTRKTCRDPPLATHCLRATRRHGARGRVLCPPGGWRASKQGCWPQATAPARPGWAAVFLNCSFFFFLLSLYKTHRTSSTPSSGEASLHPQLAQYLTSFSPQRPVVLHSTQRLGPATRWNQSQQSPPKLQNSAA